jgi:myosin heavy subunit
MEVASQRSFMTISAVSMSEVPDSVILARKSPFLEQLQQKESNLNADLVDLHRDQQKIESEQQSLDAEKLRLDQQEASIDELERSISEQENQTSIIPSLRHQLIEIRRQKQSISKILADLNANIAEAQTALVAARDFVPETDQGKTLEELREQESKLDTEDDELQTQLRGPSESEIHTAQIAAKTKDIANLKKDLEKLHEDIVHKEVETSKMEALVLQHEKNIRRMDQRRQQFDARRKVDETKKAALLADLAQREEKRKVLLGRRARVRERRQAVETEQARIDGLVNDLTMLQEQLKDQKKRDEASAKQATEDFERRERQRLEEDYEATENKKQLERQSRTEDFLKKYGDDGVVPERKLENLSRALEQKKAALEHERDREAEIWEVKIAAAERDIKELRVKAQNIESQSSLKGKLQELQAEHEELLKTIADRQDEFRQLADEFEATAESESEEGIARAAALAQLRQELEEQAAEQGKESARLKDEQQRIDVVKADLEERLSILQIRERAGKVMLVTYQRSVDSANARADALRLRLTQIRPIAT